MAWHMGIAANAVIAVAYFGISAAVLAGLRKHGGLGVNRLGTATALIFASCGLGHAEHLIHIVGFPGVAVGLEVIAARASYDWHLAAVDIVTAGIGVYYWSLRAALPADMVTAPGTWTGSADTRARALELNDTVVQTLVTAQYALEQGSVDEAREALARTLESARALASSDLQAATRPTMPGSLVRDAAASSPR